MLKDAIDLGQVRRALVIKLRHHGDVLLASPVLTVLKNHAPHVEIDALVYHDTREMITLHPAVSEVFTIDRNWKKLGVVGQLRAEWALLRQLKARGYDLVVVLNEHQRVASIVRWIGARWAIGPQPMRGSRWYAGSFSHIFFFPARTLRHTVEQQLDALRCVGIWPGPGERKLTIVSGEEAEARAATILQESGAVAGKFVLVHPGSRWFFKCWTPEATAALINQLVDAGYQIVLTAAPSQEELALIGRIEVLLTCPDRVINLAGRLSLKEMAAVVAKARVMVGVDSLPMHMAAATETPVVALFGPTKEKVWGPWQVPNRLVMADWSCRPCDRRGCAGSERSDCIEQTPVEQVLGAVYELMEETA